MTDVRTLAKQAAQNGQIHFEVESNCEKCGHNVRYVSNPFACVMCQRKLSREYREANLERVKAISKRWFIENRVYFNQYRQARRLVKAEASCSQS